MLPRSERLISVDLEISSTCQARCSMCVRRNEWGQLTDFKQTTKTLAEVKHILGGLSKQLEGMMFCGNYGDPMACEEVADICEWLIEESPKIDIGIATNGAIGKPATYARLGKLGVNITWGLDGSTQESNELYRTNVKWSDAMKNLKAYSETSIANKAAWQFLLFEQNKEHLEPAIKLAISHGIRHMYINQTPNPFAQGRILPHAMDTETIARDSDIQELIIYDTNDTLAPKFKDFAAQRGPKILHRLTPAHGMSEKIQELKDKYDSDMFFV